MVWRPIVAFPRIAHWATSTRQSVANNLTSTLLRDVEGALSIHDAIKASDVFASVDIENVGCAVVASTTINAMLSLERRG